MENSGMLKIAMIAMGGAVGALLRYFASGWAQRFAGGWFPTGTLFVNLLGCFLIGLLGALFAGSYVVREEYRAALLVGVLGAFTTFSTFGWETLALVNGGRIWLAAVNVVLSNGAGLIAVWLGYSIAKKCFGLHP